MLKSAPAATRPSQVSNKCIPPELTQRVGDLRNDVHAVLLVSFLSGRRHRAPLLYLFFVCLHDLLSIKA